MDKCDSLKEPKTVARVVGVQLTVGPRETRSSSLESPGARGHLRIFSQAKALLI